MGSINKDCLDVQIIIYDRTGKYNDSRIISRLNDINSTCKSYCHLAREKCLSWLDAYGDSVFSKYVAIPEIFLTLFAVDRQKKIIGYGIFEIEEKNRSKSAYLHLIAVDEKFRRRNIATQIQSKFFEIYPDLGKYKQSIFHTNKIALAAFEKFSKSQKERYAFSKKKDSDGWIKAILKKKK